MLDKIEIKKGIDTPYVVLDAEECYCEIEGKSYPPDVSEFYEPLIEWLDDFKYERKEKFAVSIKLDYYNTASSKMILDFFLKLDEIRNDNIDVTVSWYYPNDDEDMFECGEEFDRLVDIPFELISY